MNRRRFLQSSIILAAPAFMSASGVFRGSTELVMPSSLGYVNKPEPKQPSGDVTLNFLMDL